MAERSTSARCRGSATDSAAGGHGGHERVLDLLGAVAVAGMRRQERPRQSACRPGGRPLAAEAAHADIGAIEATAGERPGDGLVDEQVVAGDGGPPDVGREAPVEEGLPEPGETASGRVAVHRGQLRLAPTSIVDVDPRTERHAADGVGWAADGGPPRGVEPDGGGDTLEIVVGHTDVDV